MEKVDLFYEEQGHGFPLILLHGYPLDHSIWHPLIPLMQNEAHLVMPDLRGHGRSPAPDGIYSMQVMAEDILNLMDELRIKKAVLAGHSMGGYVALDFARVFPERTVGLALVASHCFADDPERAMARLETANKVEQTNQIDFIVEAMLPSLTIDLSIQAQLKRLMLQTSPKGIAGILRGMAERGDTSEVLRKLEYPAVIVAGGQDKLISLERSRAMAVIMKNPWLEVISEAGHMPMMETPSEVARILTSLVKKVKSADQ